MNKVNIREGDCLDVLPTMQAGSVNCCVTSPPYFGLRDYGNDEQIGLEETPEAFVESLVNVFSEVKRVLADDGTLWLNLGDSYFSDTKGSGGKSAKQDRNKGSRHTTKKIKRTNGIKPKQLLGIPWRVAFALQQDGWYLRQDIIWSKPNPMPESVTDRCTKAHEYIFLLSKKPKYFYDAEAIAEPFKHKDMQVEAKLRKAPGRLGVSNYSNGSGRNDAGGYTGGMGFASQSETCNKRSVWEVATQPYSGAHFATFPPKLIKPCILAGCPVGGTVLDPFGGGGTTGMVALELGRSAELIELNPDYVEIIKGRTNVTPGFNF
jgi:DNA modification methylase